MKRMIGILAIVVATVVGSSSAAAQVSVSHVEAVPDTLDYNVCARRMMPGTGKIRNTRGDVVIMVDNQLRVGCVDLGFKRLSTESLIQGTDLQPAGTTTVVKFRSKDFRPRAAAIGAVIGTVIGALAAPKDRELESGALGAAAGLLVSQELAHEDPVARLTIEVVDENGNRREITYIDEVVSRWEGRKLLVTVYEDTWGNPRIEWHDTQWLR